MLVRKRIGARVAGALALAVAACGGGTSQFDPFVPGRLIAFGDEASALTATGFNYGINGINLNNTNDNTSDDFPDCRLQPNWAQSLASVYGFVFGECNPDNLTVKAFNRAAPGARVADVEAQVDAQLSASVSSGGGFVDKDIVTVMVGVNDVVEVYRLFDGSNEAALQSLVRERGRRAGLLVNRLIGLGAKVVLANIPDVGLTPFAVRERAANADTDRAALLSRLSGIFNEQLGVTILLDGRFVAYVQADQRVLTMARTPESFALANVTEAACTTAPPGCFNTTLVSGANAGTHLWAGDLWLSFRGQSEIGQLAISRAGRNPF